MKTSGSILEGSEIRKENGKTIVKPKKRITLKEYLSSQPYKLIKDSTFVYNSGMQIKSASCDVRTYTYSYITDFAPFPGKTIGFFPSNENGDISWKEMRTM